MTTQANASQTIRSHRDLDVYWRSHDLVQLIYDLTAEFPKFEDFGLKSQLTRAAASVPANIAEGAARGSTQQFAYFLSNARASLAELDSHIEVAKRRNYITEEMAVATYGESVIIGKMLTKLRSAVLRRPTNNRPPTTNHHSPITND